MESVAAGMMGGWNCHRRVLALPSSCSSPRQVASLVNIRPYHNNFVQFSLRLSTVPSRPITIVGSNFMEKGRSCHDSFEVLQTLQRIPKDEIQSVEVLWSPRKDNEVLSEDQLLREFPRLKRIEKGIMYTKTE
ncbi:hypothetical protein POM88_051648 [Heracleum sosnowskyi]|uniref:Uncharacterized protein n=1 Tax=Heracleum sosnowskyi TaxID=360622 RepID=A0AAD8H294_9APIA|nr:hypothetical protein POM88_051648 [Heracleum sosnowskyi]